MRPEMVHLQIEFTFRLRYAFRCAIFQGNGLGEDCNRDIFSDSNVV